MKTNKNQNQMCANRREFLAQIGLGVAAIASGTMLTGILSKASEAAKAPAKPKEVPLPDGQTEVSKEDPVAKAINYHSAATSVDAKKFSQYKKGQSCSSCALYTKVNDGWGKCQMMPNGVVHSGGWCASYNKKT